MGRKIEGGEENFITGIRELILQHHVVCSFLLEDYTNPVSLPPSQRVTSIRGYPGAIQGPLPISGPTTRYNKVHLK